MAANWAPCTASRCAASGDDSGRSGRPSQHGATCARSPCTASVRLRRATSGVGEYVAHPPSKGTP